MPVRIQWTQRAAGREVGDQEEVELTPFVQGCLDQDRVFLVSEPIVGFSPHVFPEPAVEAPTAAPDSAGAEATPEVVSGDGSPADRSSETQ